jgi:hypothetical protein
MINYQSRERYHAGSADGAIEEILEEIESQEADGPLDPEEDYEE